MLAVEIDTLEKAYTKGPLDPALYERLCYYAGKCHEMYSVPELITICRNALVVRQITKRLNQ